MAQPTSLAEASLAVSEVTEVQATVGETSIDPVAWIEIESLTFSEFKQVVRVPFYSGQVIKIGRDSNKCNLRFKNKVVSPVHCEIYSIIFDKCEQYPPLIYVRDCQSASGTYVNGKLVGRQPFVSAAQLLENNDVISVGPCSLRLCDCNVPSAETALTVLQRKEALLFADKFLIKDTIIGSGAFADVYLAVDVSTNRQVVCKVHNLLSLKCHHETAIERVDREMAIWSQLDHPNIVTFHRAFRTNNTMFTFADLAAGGDLYSLLEREESIPELEMKWIAIQVLRAVDYLHSKGVAHRDIKPENILCSSSLHMHHRIVLADFGSAGVTSFGRLKSQVGTIMYKAPEILTSKKPHGIAVDIWSIGVLMLQLLAGCMPVDLPNPPFTSSDIEQLVVSVNLHRTGERNGPISQNGVDFILSCLNPQPLARPSAAKAAKHIWFRESAQQILLFKERENEMAWKPKEIIIPAVLRLPDLPQDTPLVECLPNEESNEKSSLNERINSSFCSSEREEHIIGSEVVPDSAPTSQAAGKSYQPTIQFAARSNAMAGPRRSQSMID